MDSVFSFYRTLPSDLATNIGRIGLVSRFDWLRIAVVSFQDRYYSHVCVCVCVCVSVRYIAAVIFDHTQYKQLSYSYQSHDNYDSTMG